MPKITPNYEASGEKKPGDAKQIGAGHGDEGRKSIFASIFHDDFFRVLTGISIGCWMIHELVSDIHKIFLFAGIIFTFADVFYVFGHKILPDRKWIKPFNWLIYFVCMAAVFHFRNDGESNGPGYVGPAFYVKTIFANVGLGEQTSNFLLWEYQTKALVPINIQMLVELGNLKPGGLKISSCQFEGKTKGGKWEVFPTIDRRFGDLVFHNGNYWGVQNPAENPDPLKTYFPAVLDVKSIEAEPITAYVLLEVPKDAVADFLRLRILDAGGMEYVENVSLKPDKRRLQVLVHDPLPMITYRPGSNDISKIQILPYSIVFKQFGPPEF